MGAYGIGEQHTAQATVDFATGTAITVVAATEVFRIVAVAPVRTVVPETDVGGQPAGAEVHAVHPAQEVLFVEVRKVGVVVLQHQVIGNLVATTAKPELVHMGAARGVDGRVDRVGSGVGTSDRQAFPISRPTLLDAVDTSGGEGQVVDVLGLDLNTTESLEHQTIAGEQYRQLRLQCPVAQHGIAHPRL
ncbi:hypothetical protein D3C76_995490 [compost metagenome]